MPDLGSQPKPWKVSSPSGTSATHVLSLLQPLLGEELLQNCPSLGFPWHPCALASVKKPFSFHSRIDLSCSGEAKPVASGKHCLDKSWELGVDDAWQ